MNQVNKATIQPFGALDQLMTQVRGADATNHVNIVKVLFEPVKAAENGFVVDHRARRAKLGINNKPQRLVSFLNLVAGIDNIQYLTPKSTCTDNDDFFQTYFSLL